MTRARIAVLAAGALALALSACGGGGNWPHGTTEADSVGCDYVASEAAGRLRAIPGAQDARVNLGGHGCFDYEGDSGPAHTQMWLTLEDDTSGSELVAAQAAAREIFLEEIAPQTRTFDTLVIEFNGESHLQFSYGNLPLNEAEADAIANFTSTHPKTWIVVAPKIETPTVDDADSAWFTTIRATVDARGVIEAAAMEAVLEPLWGDLNVLGDALDARNTNDDGVLPTIVLSDASYVGASSGPLVIGFENGTDFDARWAEVAALTMQLTEQPDVKRVWLNPDYRERYNHAGITLAEPGTTLSEESQGLLDRIYDVFEELGIPAVEPTLTA